MHQPHPVQADPGPIKPPQKKTTLYAEKGIFYVDTTYTVLLDIPHTGDLAVVYIASGSDWFGWFFEDNDWEVYQMYS